MPFKSQAQRRWMWMNLPKMARRWSKEHPNQILKEVTEESKEKEKEVVAQIASTA